MVRLVLIVIVVSGAVSTLALVGLLLAPAPRLRRKTADRIMDITVYLGCLLTGMRITVQGRPPHRPFLLVANHLSYVDVLLIRRVVRTRFIAKSEVAKWPLFGALASLTGTLFVQRRNKRDLKRINELMRDLWNSGDGLVFFPEGTSSAGATVRPFHAGLLAYPALQGHPVHAAAIHYHGTPERPAATHVCWWGDMTFADHLYGLLRMRHFEATLTFAPHPLNSPSRKELAAALHEQVSAVFRPVDGSPVE